MDINEKRIALSKWILETDENVLNEVEAIYDIYSDEISNEHKKILDKRLKNHEKNPTSGKNWNDIKANLSLKYGV
ncbi:MULTISPECIES: addiction module protein [unclassified Polaribacter]|uniref:addiction module protein n=1 Tax=unclassified Polaribacter TaxID=196858 RepID=UPI0011BFA053|nr:MULTISPECIES: addiction module protein [unclassified Polaribacter]TXD50568.1 addiction module protein [Polaribacter sp. IC063]TXD62023.1 addiction module protein [Polaribacter sp. IC066]